jgi:hypothetical protein
MQHVVHNRATIRVADRTDLSGRVTADEVNLERFHNRFRKVCALGRTWLVLITACMGLYLLLPDRGLAQNNQGQNGQGINGTYSVHITGYVGLPDSLIPLAVVGRVTHFINGNSGTERGFATTMFNGQKITTTFTGTLNRNLDGSGSWSEIVNQTSTTSPPLLTNLTFILYPTPDGNIINEVETDQGTVLAGVLTRGSPTGDQQ